MVNLGVEETPQYDSCDDESQNAETFPMLDEEPEVTPEWGDQYVNAEILLPRGDKMARGQVICQKCNTDGNLIDRSNKNPILNTHLYEEAFPEEEMTDSAAYIIAESMYAQCDVHRDEYLFLEAFIDHQKNGSALSVDD